MSSTRHGQRVGNVAPLLCETLVFLETQQHMGSPATIRNEHRAILGCVLRFGHILVSSRLESVVMVIMDSSNQSM